MTYDAAFRAIAAGDRAALDALLAQSPRLAAQVQDREGWPGSTLLEHAVWWCREPMVRALVDAGAPLEHAGGDPPATPLQRALEIGEDAIADLLGPACDLETAAGLGDLEGVRARLPAPPDETRRAFRLACLNGRREAARLLCPDGWFEREALVDALIGGRHLLTFDQGDTAWDFAREQLLLADPMNLVGADDRDARGRRVEQAARAGGHEALAGRIARRGASRGGRVPGERVWRPANSARQEAFLRACQWGQTARVRAFLAAQPDLVHTRTLWGMGALYLPGAYSSEDSLATALVLLDAGAEPYDGIGGPCWWGATEMVLALLERGAPPEQRAAHDSGLLWACTATRFNDPDHAERWLPIVEGLLDAGADPNLASKTGATPWGLAAESVRPVLEARGARRLARHPGWPELRSMLRTDASDEQIVRHAAADPERLAFYDDEHSGCTAPLNALLDGRRDLAERLLALKAAPDMNEAAALGDLTRVRTLLAERMVQGPRAGVGPASPQIGDIALHLAAWLGHLELCDPLLASGYSLADSNGADLAGDYRGTPALRDTTPLHLAAEGGHAVVVERFLDVLDQHWSG